MSPGLGDLERNTHKTRTAEEVFIEVTRECVIEARVTRGSGGNWNERVTARGERSADHR